MLGKLLLFTSQRRRHLRLQENADCLIYLYGQSSKKLAICSFLGERLPSFFYFMLRKIFSYHLFSLQITYNLYSKSKFDVYAKKSEFFRRVIAIQAITRGLRAFGINIKSLLGGCLLLMEEACHKSLAYKLK